MISIVCPVYNEELFIEQLLLFYERALPVEKEIFLIDGGSTDNTRSIINGFVQKNSTIHLLDNANKFVPFALNMAIKQCKGEIIIRLDAHTHYAIDYFERILEVFKTNDADIVGGPMRAVGKSSFQFAVAYATSTMFGVGNSQFHFQGYKGYTDSVYLGAWRKQIFDRIGYFDEQMIRNQDDEFHYRARSAGYKIFQDPSIISYYYPRNTPTFLFKQYYQYGLYKPLVLKKVRSGIKLRHLAPSFFVIYILLLPLLLYLSFLPVLFLLLYLSMLLFYSFGNSLNIRSKSLCLLIYPILHVSYGIGFIKGLFISPKARL